MGALAGYQIEEMIGRGGMGVVHRGRHTALDRPVAIKFLSDGLCQDPEFTSRFLREARICARLTHPGFVQVYDVGVNGDRPYLVMELLEGESLRARLRRGALPEQEAVAVACRVLDALGRAHALGVVHRDIKPGNVFLCRDGAVKLMDFGIARMVGEARLTGTGAQLGTPEYMSPEQVEGRTADARSDLYAVGVLLHEMLTGQAPFWAETPVAVLHLQLTKAPPPLPGTVSAGVRAVVERALAKAPGARFPSADAMRAALEAPVAAPPAEASVGDPPSIVSRGAQPIEVRRSGPVPVARPRAARGPQLAAGIRSVGAAALLFAIVLLALGVVSDRSGLPSSSPSASYMPAMPSSAATPPVPGISAEQRMIRKGNELFRRKRWKDAEDAFVQAVRLNMGNPESWNDLAVTRLRRGKLAAAEAALRQAVRLSPDGFYHANLAAVLFRRGKLKPAREYARQAKRLGCDSHWVYGKLGL